MLILILFFIFLIIVGVFKMANIDLAGIFLPVVTPFTKEEVTYDYLIENINKWNNSGLKRFVVLGSNGENVFLSEAEKRWYLHRN